VASKKASKKQEERREIFAVYSSFRDQVELERAEVIVREKTVRLVRFLNGNGGAFRYRRMIPISEVHFSAETAIAAFRNKLRSQLKRSEEKSEHLRKLIATEPTEATMRDR